MFQLIIGTIFSIIFLCGLANEKVSDAAWRARSDADSRAFAKSMNRERVAEVRKQVTEAFKECCDNARKKVWDSYGDPYIRFLKTHRDEEEAKRKEELEREILSHPLFDNIKEDLLDIFPDGVTRYVTDYYSTGYYETIESFFCSLLLAHEGLINKEWHCDAEGRISIFHPTKDTRFGRNIPYERRLAVTKRVEYLVREKNPSLRMYCYYKHEDHRILDWDRYDKYKRNVVWFEHH